MIPGLVSTIIPVFNRSSLLREAVASVLAQSYRPIEIILVDDGSTDDTPHVCSELAKDHAEVRFIRQSNAGPGAAREAGRRCAVGEFLQYLDSDDVLDPRKFALQVAGLRAYPDCGVAYCKTREYHRGGPPREQASLRTGERLPALFPWLLSGRCWQTVTPLFRRSVCDAAGPWTSLRQEEDWEYDARIGALGTRLAWCPEFLADFRHHEGIRAGGGSLDDPRKMAWRAEAHRLIWDHARRAGIGPDDPHMRHFARALFLLARQCGAAGLVADSRSLFDLAYRSTTTRRGDRWDLRIYRAAAAVIGWRRAGQLSCWSDHWRGRSVSSDLQETMH